MKDIVTPSPMARREDRRAGLVGVPDAFHRGALAHFGLPCTERGVPSLAAREASRAAPRADHAK